MYAKGAAVAANPYTLRQIGGLTFSGISKPMPQVNQKPILTVARSVTGGSMRRSDSPPRASFKILNKGVTNNNNHAMGSGLTISLNSLR
jgi:hypothetical protein